MTMQPFGSGKVFADPFQSELASLLRVLKQLDAFEIVSGLERSLEKEVLRILVEGESCKALATSIWHQVTFALDLSGFIAQWLGSLAREKLQVALFPRDFELPRNDFLQTLHFAISSGVSKISGGNISFGSFQLTNVVLPGSNADRSKDTNNATDGLHPSRRIFAEVDRADQPQNTECHTGAYGHPRRRLQRPGPANSSYCFHADLHALKAASIRKLAPLGETS